MPQGQPLPPPGSLLYLSALLRALFVPCAALCVFYAVYLVIRAVIASYTEKLQLDRASPTPTPPSTPFISPSTSPDDFNRQLFYHNLNNSSLFLRRDSFAWAEQR